MGSRHQMRGRSREYRDVAPDPLPKNHWENFPTLLEEKRKGRRGALESHMMSFSSGSSASSSSKSDTRNERKVDPRMVSLEDIIEERGIKEEMTQKQRMKFEHKRRFAEVGGRGGGRGAWGARGSGGFPRGSREFARGDRRFARGGGEIARGDRGYARGSGGFARGERRFATAEGGFAGGQRGFVREGGASGRGGSRAEEIVRQRRMLEEWPVPKAPLSPYQVCAYLAEKGFHMSIEFGVVKKMHPDLEYELYRQKGILPVITFRCKVQNGEIFGVADSTNRELSKELACENFLRQLCFYYPGGKLPPYKFPETLKLDFSAIDRVRHYAIANNVEIMMRPASKVIDGEVIHKIDYLVDGLEFTAFGKGQERAKLKAAALLIEGFMKERPPLLETVVGEDNVNLKLECKLSKSSFSLNTTKEQTDTLAEYEMMLKIGKPDDMQRTEQKMKVDNNKEEKKEDPNMAAVKKEVLNKEVIIKPEKEETSKIAVKKEVVVWCDLQGKKREATPPPAVKMEVHDDDDDDDDEDDDDSPKGEKRARLSKWDRWR